MIYTKQMTPEDIEKNKDYFDNYELEPCPFCGCEMEIFRERSPYYDDMWLYYVIGKHEPDCYLYNEPDNHWFQDKDRMIKAWNKRVKE